MSDTHVKDGNIISFFFLFLYSIFSIDIVKRFAEEPEFTNTLYFTPSHLDHSVSNFLTYLD